MRPAAARLPAETAQGLLVPGRGPGACPSLLRGQGVLWSHFSPSSSSRLFVPKFFPPEVAVAQNGTGQPASSGATPSLVPRHDPLSCLALCCSLTPFPRWLTLATVLVLEHLPRGPRLLRSHLSGVSVRLQLFGFGRAAWALALGSEWDGKGEGGTVGETGPPGFVRAAPAQRPAAGDPVAVSRKPSSTRAPARSC